MSKKQYVLPDDPKETCELMLQQIIANRIPDNAGEKDEINHGPEILTAASFSGWLRRRYEIEIELDPLDIQALMIFHAGSRVVENASVGRVLHDKVVDTGGWARVMADYVQRAGK